MSETPCGRAPSCSLTLAAAVGVRLPSPLLRSGVVAGNVVPIGVARGPTVSRRYLGRAGPLLCREPGAPRLSDRAPRRHGANHTYLLNRFTKYRVRWTAGHPQSPHCGFPSLWRFTSPPNRQRRPQPSPAWPRRGQEPGYVVVARLAEVRFCEPNLAMFRNWPSVASQGQVRTVNRT